MKKGYIKALVEITYKSNNVILTSGFQSRGVFDSDKDVKLDDGVFG